VRWRPAHLALVIGGLFMVVVAAAQMAGHWQSGLSAGEFRMLLRAMEAPVLSRLEF
jgi:hypothetical protein